MEINLIGSRRSYSLDSSVWGFLIDLALWFEWKPLGTIAARHEDWSGNLDDDLELAKLEPVYGRGTYTGNDGFIVKRPDAAALSRELQHAIRLNKTMPRKPKWIPMDIFRDQMSEAEKKQFFELRESMAVGPAPCGDPAALAKYKDKLPEKVIQEVIDLCNEGAFRIS